MTAATKKKKKIQPTTFEMLPSNVESAWPTFRSHGRMLLFLKRADWRFLENDTNSNVWPKGNSNGKDTRTVFIFQDRGKRLGAQK